MQQIPWVINDIYVRNIYILNVKGADYLCIINKFSKSKAMKLFKNIDLTSKKLNIKNKKKQKKSAAPWSCKFTLNSNLNGEN